MVTRKANRARSLDMKVLAMAVCLILLVVLVAPISTVDAGNPAVMNVIQYRYFATQDQLFNALLTPDYAGGVDVMGWPLTTAEYQTAINNPNIVVEPLSEAGEFELAFNNNWTDGILLDRRSPMNFTDFRNAMNCLVDKNGVINGTTLGGFATRDDTQIPQPLMSGFVNPAVSYPNYPWEFNVTHALEILWNGNWYNHAYYPTLVDLIETYSNGTLSTYVGTVYGAVYSGNDTNGKRGGSDANAAFNAALANTPLQPLIGYYRTSDGRKDMIDFFCNELQSIGCPNNYVQYRPLLYGDNPVTYKRSYDFAALGYSMGAPPDWFYTELTPIGIYPGGPNPYMVDDTNMTYWATQMYNAPTQALYQVASNNVQDILVMESELVSVYTPATYCAYKVGMLGQIDEVGFGTQGGWLSQLMNWITLNSRKTNTINYTGPPSGTPESNIIYYGEYNPPDMLNPVFGDYVFDYQILDEIFTYPFATNPYNDIAPGSAITGFPSGSDLPWMIYSWTLNTIPSPTGSGQDWTNVTYYFRNDITWQDGAPFTVADLNYTIWTSAVYADSWDNAAMILCTNASDNYAPYFTAWDNWTCSILVSSSNWLNLYVPNYEIIPQHLYQYIMPNNITAAEQGYSTDGLHGLWPGQAAVAGNLLSGAPWTLSQLQSNPETTLVGTGPWKYRVGSTSASQFVAGGGITLDAYSGFFLTPAPGAIAFKYTWLNTSPDQQPSGGYYKVGLSDLVYLANAYGTTGTPPANMTGGISGIPGASHTWNPAADLAAPSGTIGLSDLVTLATHYGWYYGNYSYSAPYPPSEVSNGGP